jgi:hypothetical protein
LAVKIIRALIGIAVEETPVTTLAIFVAIALFGGE